MEREYLGLLSNCWWWLEIFPYRFGFKCKLWVTDQIKHYRTINNPGLLFISLHSEFWLYLNAFRLKFVLLVPTKITVTGGNHLTRHGIWNPGYHSPLCLSWFENSRWHVILPFLYKKDAIFFTDYGVVSFTSY